MRGYKRVQSALNLSRLIAYSGSHLEQCLSLVHTDCFISALDCQSQKLTDFLPISEQPLFGDFVYLFFLRCISFPNPIKYVVATITDVQIEPQWWQHAEVNANERISAL